MYGKECGIIDNQLYKEAAGVVTLAVFKLQLNNNALQPFPNKISIYHICIICYKYSRRGKIALSKTLHNFAAYINNAGGSWGRWLSCTYPRKLALNMLTFVGVLFYR